ncbi:MAG TPA: methyltransferase domain-containing protein [Burkholderiaceae bacterium]|nr:methyltransferase domain-containing protein [Burkholderiaceae bacterium]
MSAPSNPVVSFYETHPISEQQILDALRARGIALDRVTEDTLQEFDQDHYGGVPALRALAQAAGIRAEHHVLDVCSGLGGPARWLAHTIGCRVTGLDFTESRHRGAVSLTRLARLDDRVSFRHGDALQMPFDDAAFDVVMSEEAFAHIPDKPRLIAQCVRVTKPGGAIAFTDIVHRGELDDETRARLEQGMTFTQIESVAGYRRLLEANGCAIETADDLSDQWTQILQQRLQMYRSLRDSTIARLGVAHFERYDRAYGHFVGLYSQRVLGGVRIVARKRQRLS